MAESMTQYKITILYMLDCVDFPLTNTQIVDFMLGMDYTDYFTTQYAISELLLSGLIRKEAVHGNTHYHLTKEGKDTLAFFADKISPAIREDVISYFKEKKMRLREEVSIVSDYYKTPSHDYAVRCRIKQGSRTFLELTLSVPSEEQAKAACANWRTRKDDVYAYLMDLLLQ